MIPREIETKIRELLLEGQNDHQVAEATGVSRPSVGKRRRALGLSAHPKGRAVQFSPMVKRRAIRLARKHGIPFAAAQTGITNAYVKCLMGGHCRVKGFEGHKTGGAL